MNIFPLSRGIGRAIRISLIWGLAAASTAGEAQRESTAPAPGSLGSSLSLTSAASPRDSGAFGPVSADGFTSQSSEWEATGFNNGRRLVRDSNGYFHAVWHTSTTLPSAPAAIGCQILYAHTTAPAAEPPSMARAGSWSTPVVMTPPALGLVDNRYPSLAVENADYDTGQWKAVNKLHVVWQGLPAVGGRYEVYHASIPVTDPPSAPAPWASVANLSNSPTDSLVPAICINHYGPVVSNQHIHVVWQEEDTNRTGIAPAAPEDAGFSDIAYTRSTDGGATWGGPAGGWETHAWDNVTSSASNSQMPTIACIQDRHTSTPAFSGRAELGYETETVHIAYNEDAGPAGIKLFYRASADDGLTWNPRLNLTDGVRNYAGNEAYPSIAVDMADLPHVVAMTDGLTRAEPQRTETSYQPGISPLLNRAFPGPGVGMYAAAPNAISYYNLTSSGWTNSSPGSGGDDNEFPTVALDRWMHVSVSWQAFTVSTADYEVVRATRLNTQAPQFPVAPPQYGPWRTVVNDSQDAAGDELLPNLAFKKSSTYFTPREGTDSDPQARPGYDQVWTRVPGHGGAATQPDIRREVWQDGNMTYDTHVIPSADLSVTKSVAPDPVARGQKLTYTIITANNGPDTATDVTVTDVLPAGLVVNSITPSAGGVSVSGSTVTLSVPALAAGATNTLTIVATPTADGQIINTVAVSGNEADPDTDDRTASAAVTVVPRADLSIRKTASPNPVAAGNQLTYTLAVRNLGPGEATGVTVVDALPTGCIQYLNSSGTQGTTTESAGLVTAAIGTLAPDAEATVTVAVRVEGAGELLANAASVTANEPDPVPGNNSDSANAQVTGAGLLGNLRDDRMSTTTGWFPFYFPIDPNLSQTDLDVANQALRVRVFARQDRLRANGWFTLADNYIPFSSIGTDNYVRGKFYMYTGAQAVPSQLNSIPNIRVRLSNRFAVTALLEVFNHTSQLDPGIEPFALELRLSSNPSSPTLYRVDFAPLAVPFLLANQNTEGVMRAFEAFCTDPQDNGLVAMKESVVSVYPKSALSDCRTPVRVFAPTASDAGNMALALPGGSLINQNYDKVVTVEAAFNQLVADPPTSSGVHSEGAFGVTLDTTRVPVNRIGVMSREFAAGSDVLAPDYLRVEPGRQYKIRWHITSTQQSNLNTQMRMRARAIRFSYTLKNEVGGAWSTGSGEVSSNNAIAQQALPGIGCQLPEKNGTENGGWYTMLMNTPMDPDIRGDFAPGTPLSTRMPNITGQPGPQQPGSSIRDLKFGFDLIDTITSTPNSPLEKGNATVDRIEVRQYTLIPDE